MVLGEHVGYTLEYSINMLLALTFVNYFDTWEGYFVIFLLGALGRLMIFTGEVYFVGL